MPRRGVRLHGDDDDVLYARRARDAIEGHGPLGDGVVHLRQVRLRPAVFAGGRKVCVRRGTVGDVACPPQREVLRLVHSERLWWIRLRRGPTRGSVEAPDARSASPRLLHSVRRRRKGLRLPRFGAGDGTRAGLLRRQEGRSRPSALRAWRGDCASRGLRRVQEGRLLLPDDGVCLSAWTRQAGGVLPFALARRRVGEEGHPRDGVRVVRRSGAGMRRRVS